MFLGVARVPRLVELPDARKDLPGRDRGANGRDD